MLHAIPSVGPDGRDDLAFPPGLRDISDRYDLLLCDIWGVLHDGLSAFPAAGDALSRYRAGGGRVVLVSNAPRPGALVTRQLDQFGVPRSAYDDIRTSGDLTRALVASRGEQPFHHVGPERDLGLFRGLPGRSVPVREAAYVVCTGLVDDETETVEDYAAALAAMRERDLEMICANPDLVVERGDRLILCAGALAAAYEEIGGRAVTHGKPYRPIYDAAFAVGSELLGRAVDRRRVVAVGDAIRTDVAGGHAAGIDTLLLARGIHAVELLTSDGNLDHGRVRAWVERQSVRPTMVARELAWEAAG